MKKSTIASISYLKNLARTGWMQRGIPSSIAESVAEHSFEAAVIAFKLSKFLENKGEKVNAERAAVIALLHDLPEIFTGDIPRWSSLRIKNKAEIESKAIQEFDKEIKEVLEEYSSLSSIESKIAFISDRLSTMVQANYYYKLGFKEVKEIELSSKKDIVKIINKDKKLRKIKKLILSLSF